MSGTVSTRWYFPDWMSDPGVRASSFAARGLWMDMLSIAGANKNREHGYLLVAGKKPTDEQLAKLFGGSAEEVARLTAELESNRVFSRDRRGVIYSRRMVRAEKSRGNGRQGGNPNLLKPKQDQKQVQPRANPPIPEPVPEPKKETLPSGESARREGDLFGKPPKRKMRLPDDWRPSEVDKVYAAEHGFEGARLDALAEAFADHHHSRGNVMAKWPAAWRTWVRNEVKFAARAQRPGRGGGMARVALNLMRQNQNRGGV